MLARLCTRFLRALKKRGFTSLSPECISTLSGGTKELHLIDSSKTESIVRDFEKSWKNPSGTIDLSSLPSVDDFKDAVEDICEAVGIDRIAVFFDEAAHIFRPEQQRQFFTLFRDLRSPYITCNAAVYPGVTSYGPTFQIEHDATPLRIERDILKSSYVDDMREIAFKQADTSMTTALVQRKGNFAALAYAANGNPRLLLKTIGRTKGLKTNDVNEAIRNFYRGDVWAEHSGLVARYPGYKPMIDWGRNFIENEILPELHKRNQPPVKSTTCYFWIHRDAPQPIKEAIRLLSYTGIVNEDSPSIKARRSEIGTRYAANFGCLIAQSGKPANTALSVINALSKSRQIEFGSNHESYMPLLADTTNMSEISVSDILEKQLAASVDRLDITPWQKSKLKEIGLNTVGAVLDSTEDKLQEAYYVGEKRARRMRNAAISAVFEYLSG